MRSARGQQFWRARQLFAAALLWPFCGYAANTAPREFFPDQPKGLGEHYTAWKASYVGEVLANVSGGIEQGAIYEGYFKVGFALNVEKLAGWENTVLYANVLSTHGDSLTDRYVGDLNVVSNIDAYDTIRVFKLFLQRTFADDRVSLRLGIMAVDKDFFSSQGASVLLNSGFGAFPVLGQNFVAPIYPVSAPGVRVTWAPTERVLIRAALFSGDVGTPASNQHGTRFRFSSHDGIAAFIEGTYTTVVPGDLHGAYKLGAFYDSKRFDNVRGGQSLRGDYGIYAIGDQQLWREPGSAPATPQGLNAFARVAFVPSDRNLVHFDTEAGLNYVGLIRGRDNDILAAGVLYSHISADARGRPVQPYTCSHEAVVEISYQAAVNEWLTLQPDLQYIANPGAVRQVRDAVVTGVRCTVGF